MPELCWVLLLTAREGIAFAERKKQRQMIPELVLEEHQNLQDYLKAVQPSVTVAPCQKRESGTADVGVNTARPILPWRQHMSSAG